MVCKTEAGEGGNRVTQTAYNADDRVQSVKRAVGTPPAQIYAAYTPNGLPATMADARNNLTTYQYDGHDRKVKALYPDKVTAGVSSATDYEQYGFDANGNVVSLRKRNGQSLTLAYDNLNRLVARSYPAAADNVVFAYDLLNRKTAANYANASYNVGYVWDADTTPAFEPTQRHRQLWPKTAIFALRSACYLRCSSRVFDINCWGS